MANIDELKRRYSRIEKKADIEDGWIEVYRVLRTLTLTSDLPNKQELFEAGLKGLLKITLSCDDEDFAVIKDLSRDIALYWEHLPEKREDLLWF